MTKYMSGWECFADANGAADGGCLNSANLTSDPTGLKNRTDAEIRTMMLDGKRPDGKNLFPLMPYWMLHNMKSEDADAIIAYLRTVPPVAHHVPPNDPPFDNVPTAATPLDPQKIPTSDGGPENGRYLATTLAGCINCHTPETAPGSSVIDPTMFFAGGRQFPLPPPFTRPSTSNNLTSDPTGLGGTHSAQELVRVIKQGVGLDDAGVCPPMPAGPMGPFGGMTDQDALDIANYVLGLAPISHAVSDTCP